jgi:hypothetical protein
VPDNRARPDDRYGDRSPRPRPGVVAAIVLVASAFVGWVVWAALGAASPDVTGQVERFRIESPAQVHVEISVTADRGRAVRCTLQAQDKDHAPVGVARVTVPAGERRTRAAEADVRTRSRAVTAVLSGCRLVPPTE